MKEKIMYLFIIGFVIFVSCDNGSKIEGHWHLKRQNIDTEYWTLDIKNKNDTIADVDNYSFESYKIRHFPKEKHLVTGDCGGFFNYKVNFSGAKIYLKNVQDYGDFIGEKHVLNNSHILKDYEKDLFVHIRFPRKTNIKIKSTAFKQRTLTENIIIGRPKFPKDLFYRNKIRIQVRNKFINLKDFEKFIEDVKAGYNDNDLNHLKFRFICDYNITVSFLNPILKKIKSNGFHNNYLTCLKKETKKIGDIFEYVHFNNLDLSVDKKINDLLK